MPPQPKVDLIEDLTNTCPKQDIEIRQGTTFCLEIAIANRYITIPRSTQGTPGIQKGVSLGSIEISLDTPHCLEPNDHVNLSGVSCKGGCGDLNGCYKVSGVVDAKTFTIQSTLLDNDCVECSGGFVIVPEDLTGAQVCSEIRQSFSTAKYLPPVGAVSISEGGSTAFVYTDNRGQRPIQIGDLVNLAGAVPKAFVLSIKTPGRCGRGSDIVLSETATSTLTEGRLELCTDPLATLTAEIVPECGIVRLILSPEDSQNMPIPWPLRDQRGCPDDGDPRFGPYRWDVMLKLTDKTLCLRRGDVWLIPSTTD